MNIVPPYLCDPVTLFSDTHTLPIWYHKADHSFVVAVKGLWNELLIRLREVVFVTVFKRLLKMHLHKCYVFVVYSLASFLPAVL